MKQLLLAVVALTGWLGSAWAQYDPGYTVLQSLDRFDVRADASHTHNFSELRQVDSIKGIAVLGEQRIPFNPALETLEVQEAYTLTPGGTRIDVSPEAIRTQDDTDESASIYSGDKVKIIIFPKLEVGSQVFYRAQSVQHTPVFPGHFYTLNILRPFERIKQAVFELSHPQAIAVSVAPMGLSGGRVDPLSGDDADRLTYRFTYAQAEALPYEPDMVALSDFAPRFLASTFKDYASIAQAYQVRAAPMVEVTPAISILAKSLVDQAETQQEKVRILYNWVSQNIRYLGVYAAHGGFVPHPAQSILDNRFGDCKDYAVLLEAMLKAVGIASTPVLLNASNAYQLPTTPVPVFDHVITYVPELDLYLDATSRFTPMGLLPDADMDRPVLHTATGQQARTPAMQAAKDYTRTVSVMRLNQDGTVSGTSQAQRAGQFETSSRMAQYHYKNRDAVEVVNRLLSKHQVSGTGSVKSPDPNDLATPWLVDSTFELDPVVNTPGPSAMTIPVGLAPGDLKALSASVVKKQSRFPARCEAKRHIEETTLTLDGSLRIKRVPKDVQVRSGALSYDASYTLKGQVIDIKRVFSADYQGPVCGPSDTLDRQTVLGVMRRDFRQQIFFD